MARPDVPLRIRRPEIARPYPSPLGVPGAALAGLIAVVTFATLVLVEADRPVVIGVAVWYALGLPCFALVGRHRLATRAPEEEFALLHEVDRELHREMA